MKSEEYLEEIREVNGTSVRITTYRIGMDYHCHISSVDPGATIARATAGRKEDAVQEAYGKASKRIVIKGRSI